MYKKISILILFFVSTTVGVSQSWKSSNQVSSSEDIFELATQFDVSNDLYTFGYFTGSITTPIGDLNSFGGRDYFLIKYLENGDVNWIRNIGSNLDDFWGGSIITDVNDNVYALGGFMGDVKFTDTDSVSTTGLFDTFLAKYDQSGNLLWGKNIGTGASHQIPTTIGIDDNGDVLVSGFFADSINFDNQGTLIADNSWANSYYAKFEQVNGNLLWAKQIKPIDSSTGGRIYETSLNNGSHILSGTYGDSIGFETDTIVSMNSSLDVFILKTNVDGDIEWIRSIKGELTEYPTSITTGDNNSIYVSGYYNSASLIIDSTDSQTINIVANNGDNDMFIIKYTQDGELEWARTIGGLGNDRPLSLDFFNDEINATGYFSDTVQWGGNELSTQGTTDTDMFIGSLTADGNFRSANSYGGVDNSTEQGRALFSNGTDLYTIIRSNSSELILNAENIHTSTTDKFYMVMGIIGCNPISVDNTLYNDVSTCFGDTTGSIQITATGGFGGPWVYSIDNGSSSSDNAFFGNLPAGEYQVVVIDDEGCAETGPLVTLTQPDSLEAILESSVDIKYHIAWNGPIETTDGSLVVTAAGGTGPYTFQLLPGGTPQALGTYYFPYPDSGKYVVAVQDLNNCGPVNTDTVVISVERTDATGIGDQDGVEMKVYPNPTSGIVTIEMPFEGRKCRLEVVNMTGQTVLKSKVYSNGGVITETLDLSNQAKGLYMIRINGEALQSTIMVK